MKKLRYIPGMFSIILLPLLGYIYFQSNGYFKQFGAFDISYIDLEFLQEYDDLYDDLEIHRRSYTEVTFNGNIEESKKTLQYVDDFTDKIIETKDTINGLKIHLGNQATYNEFIQLLDVLWEKPREDIWFFDNNTIMLAGKDWEPTPPEYEDFTFIEICSGAYFTEEAEPKFNFQQIFDNLKTQFLQSKIIYSAYFIFVFVALTYLIKRKST